MIVGMRREAEFFEDQEMDLLYIGKKLSRAQEAEDALTAAGVDYAVEVDQYVGGMIFRTSRAGAFIYVLPDEFTRAADVLRGKGLDPLEQPADPAAQ